MNASCAYIVLLLHSINFAHILCHVGNTVRSNIPIYAVDTKGMSTVFSIRIEYLCESHRYYQFLCFQFNLFRFLFTTPLLITNSAVHKSYTTTAQAFCISAYLLNHNLRYCAWLPRNIC